MSLFKVNRGNEANLPIQLTDGWAYFCTDTGSFLIDHYNSTNTLVRSKVNAEYADKLRYVQNEEPVDAPDGTLWIDMDTESVDENDDISIFVDATLTQAGQAADAKAVGDALATKQPKGNYATEDFVKNKIAEAELGGEEVDLSGYATKEYVNTALEGKQPVGDYLTEIPSQYVTEAEMEGYVYTKTQDYITSIPDEYVTESELLDKGYLTSYTETDPTVPAWAKAATKPTYTASEVGARPNTWMPTAADVGALPIGTKIPSKTSDLTNDSGFITSYTETDPTVPSWAKASTKPTYTKSEVGLGDVENKSSATIRSELTKENVTDALGYTPLESYTLPEAGSSLGGVKSGGDVTISSGVITVKDDSHNHTIDNVDDLQTTLDNKANKSEGAFYIEGSGTTDATAKTSTWIGTSDRITEYYDGLTIRYKIGIEGQSTVTLNINNLGAKTVYRFNTTKLTTQFPVGSIVNLIYHTDLNDGCWITNDYDANTNTYQRVYASTTNKEYPITTRYNNTTGETYYAEYGRYTTGVTLNPSTNTITATAFKGKLTGNADTATKATQDASGNVIVDTYETKSNVTTKLTEVNNQINQLSSEKANKSGLTLGVHTDGLVYIFIDGAPHGNGLDIKADVVEGDVFGYVDENNVIVLNGVLTDGTYTIKYEMEDGNTVEIGDLVLDTNVYYSVTNNLTNCTNSNSAIQVVQGGSYSATITANDGYELKSVTVTMGGATVSVSGGNISIESVTGNIVITAVAEVAGTSYTNLLPLAVDASGNDYVGTNGEDGYKSGYKMSTSSGNESAASGAYCSGFIPITDIYSYIRIKNITLSNTVNVNNLVFYDSSKTKIGTSTANGTAGAFHTSVTVESNGVYRCRPMSWVTDSEGLAFFRFSCGGITDETIVTVDEEIV